MKLPAFLLAVTLSVPSLSRADLERLTTEFLAARVPVVKMYFHATVDDAGEAALARAGLARVVAKWHTLCGNVTYNYAPSPSLIWVAERRGWKVEGPANAGARSIAITVGRFAYVRNSLSILDSSPALKYIDFEYRLLENENAKTLAFLAPPADWYLDDDTLSGGYGMTLADVLRPQIASFGLARSNGRWVLFQQTHVRAVPIAGSTCAQPTP